ncbi:MAG TPA: AsmA family protein [Geopsychrobacteraceae bacterium]|nr:AsmA family protein [Geopsychrobacteraceae bacterium]
MNRNKKILLVSAAILVSLLLGLVLVVHLLVTPERVKGWVMPVLEEKLHREVFLADVKIGLLSGIVLQGLEIREHDGQNNLLQIEELALSYQFWPLLGGQLIVDDIHLVRPKIRLVQNVDGSLSIDDLLSSSQAEPKAAPSSDKSAEENDDFNLLVSRVLLEGGDFMLINKADRSGNIHLQQLRVLATNISLQESFPLELSVRFNETDFQFKGDYQIPASRGRLDLYVKRLDLNKFISSGPAGAPSKTASEKKPSSSEEPGPVSLPVSLAGSVQIDELLYQEMMIKAVRADYQLEENRFQLQQLIGDIFDGGFKLRADVDLGVKGFAYSGDFSVDGVDLQKLVPALLPRAEKSSHGLLQVQLDFSGAGTVPQQLINQLVSQGSFKLAQGKLMGNPLLTELAKFLGNPELKVLSFQTLTGTYDLKQGMANIQAALDSSRTRFDSSGTVDLDGPLNLKLETRLAPEMLEGLSSGSPLRQAFTDPDGWGVLPLKLSGSYADPKFSLSTEGLRSQVKEKAKQKVTEEIQKQLGEEGSSVKDLLDAPLKKLFGN